MSSARRRSQGLPTLDVLVRAAEAGLHPWVQHHVPASVRRIALEEELDFWLNTAAQDLGYAAAYARDAPQSGQPKEAYLDRWVHLGSDANILIGPRYLGRDPDLPFVGVSASDRPLVPADRELLVRQAHRSFAAFGPRFVMLTTADPIGAWPHTHAEKRQLVALLGDLRRRVTSPELTISPRTDTDFYERYRDIHAAHVTSDPAHTRRAGIETREDLKRLAEQGLVFDVCVEGSWAGIVAGEPDAHRGVRGATVIELILDHEHRGLGYGQQLSTLLAKALPMPDDECLMGTVHADNIPAYRAARRAGRVDVGGEIVIPLDA